MLIKLCICLLCSREGSEDSFSKPRGQPAYCLFPLCTLWKVNWKKLVKSLCQRLPWYKSKTLHGEDQKLKTTAKPKDFRRESICWVQRAKQQQREYLLTLPVCKRVLHMQVLHYWQVWRGNRNTEVTALACLQSAEPDTFLRHRLASCFDKQSKTGQSNHKKYHKKSQTSCPGVESLHIEAGPGSDSLYCHHWQLWAWKTDCKGTASSCQKHGKLSHLRCSECQWKKTPLCSLVSE